MVNVFSLNEYVHFVGSRIGSELNLIMDKADIGVSSLALFRAGGGHDPIKTKEFIARGIPVILGYEDKLVDMNLPYIMKVNEYHLHSLSLYKVNSYLQVYLHIQLLQLFPLQ